MLKIQYALAGFFIGAFIALLLAIVESRLIDSKVHPARLFIIIGITVIFLGITGMLRGLKMAKRKELF